MENDYLDKPSTISSQTQSHTKARSTVSFPHGGKVLQTGFVRIWRCV